jgi:hypothetical protein
MITLPLDTLRQRWANAWASAQPLLTRSLLWRRPAVCLWLALLLGVTVRVLVSEPHRGTVYPVYALAAQRWLAGESAYVTRADHNQPIYRYAPVVTPWFVPLSSLPEPLGSLLWRAVNLAVLAVGLSCWLRLVLPLTLSRRRQGLLLAVIAPLALGSVNNAQANVLVLGLLLIGTAAIARRGWWVAVLCLSLACWLKVYPVVLLALLLVLYPRQLAWRAAIVLPLLALTPFAFQSSTFVLEQYRDWLIQMRLDDRADHCRRASPAQLAIAVAGVVGGSRGDWRIDAGRLHRLAGGQWLGGRGVVCLGAVSGRVEYAADLVHDVQPRGPVDADCRACQRVVYLHTASPDGGGVVPRCLERA